MTILDHTVWKDTISVLDGLLLNGMRLIIPASLQSSILQHIQQAHQGIEKCHQEARHSVWWPGLSTQSRTMVQQCNSFKTAETNKFPIIPMTEGCYRFV